MTVSEWLERAKEGDAAAISALLNQSLQPKGITVRAERQDYCLRLWLTGQTFPPQETLVAYLRRRIDQWQVASIGILQIYAEPRDSSVPGWQVELSLLAPAAETYPIPEVPLTKDSEPDTANQAHSQEEPSHPSTEPALEGTAILQTWLKQRGLPAQVVLQGSQLHIRWPAVRVTNPKQAAAQVYTLLVQQDLNALGLDEIETLVVSGLNSRRQVVWRQTLPLPHPVSVVEDSDLMSFNNRFSNGLIFPALMGLGMIMNAIPLVNALLQGIKIWIHEFGHATIAWLAGRQAIPLPIGWTSVNPQRSLFVYLAVLTLLGLLFWAGRREQKRWPMALAIGLAVIQFGLTWLISPATFDMLLAFGGIGGELYLSALLIVGFYFPLPDYWRWDFYRFPVVLGAAFTFWGQFGLWQQIRRGGASIPFGSLWGDPAHGDMNILADRHGWTPGDIISTYSGIANLSMLVILGVYGYALFKQRGLHGFTRENE
jgi:hypothetical protein